MRRTKPDLHVHSRHSDGKASIPELVRRAQALGITHLAVTDHDTLAGSDELMALGGAMRVFRGAELSLRDLPGLHLLVYGQTPGSGIREQLRILAGRRENRARAILAKLDDLSMPLQWEELPVGESGVVGRPHIARAMVRRGYVTSVQEAFDRFLGEGKPACVQPERLSIAEALSLARADGWIPVLAHPRELELPDEQLACLVEHWQRQGLRGLEVWHPSAAAEGFAPLERLARRLGLLVTGGSDDHQSDSLRHVSLGCMADAWTSAEKDIRALESALQEGPQTT
ncbi:MAG: PHP domain-containing protein [Clostridia bacterium]|nr:PHP domain-containing protein [Clostridia bacterium]